MITQDRQKKRKRKKRERINQGQTASDTVRAKTIQKITIYMMYEQY